MRNEKLKATKKGKHIKELIKFKSIPKALHNTEVPKDSSFFRNTQINLDNPQLVESLSKDIFKYMKSIESVYQPRANYIDRNSKLNMAMRAR